MHVSEFPKFQIGNDKFLRESKNKQEIIREMADYQISLITPSLRTTSVASMDLKGTETNETPNIFCKK